MMHANDVGVPSEPQCLKSPKEHNTPIQIENRQYVLLTNQLCLHKNVMISCHFVMN